MDKFVILPARGKHAQGRFVMIDEQDAHLLMTHSYTVFRPEFPYLRRGTAKHKTYFLHREIMNAKDGQEVDHINGNPLDNRRCNLRLADKAKNQYNKKPISTKTYRGVFPPSTKWRARIQINGKLFNIGSFATAEAAARAYDVKAKELFGSFARLNFPVEGD